MIRPGTRRDVAGVERLLALEGLRVPVVGSEFVVCEADGRIVGCGRAEALPEGGTFVGDVVVEAAWRDAGIAQELVAACLERARYPVYTVTPNPVFAERFGLEPADADSLPPSLGPHVAARSTTVDPVWTMRLLRPRAPRRLDASRRLTDRIDL